MVSLSKYFIICTRQEEDINNPEWQNHHDLAAVPLAWKAGNAAQHSKEKIWVTLINVMEIQVKYLFQPKLSPTSSFKQTKVLLFQTQF